MPNIAGKELNTYTLKVGSTANVDTEVGVLAIDMNNNKLVNLADGTLPTDSISLGQLQTALENIPYIDLIDKPYTIESYHSATLPANTAITPISNAILNLPLSLSFPVIANDVIEINTSLAADYGTYNDIGDTFALFYKIDAGANQTTIPIGMLTGGDNNQETASGSLYTPILMTAAGTLTLTFDIKTKANTVRTFLLNHCGILAKIVRK